jgi:hypothetical protein
MDLSKIVRSYIKCMLEGPQGYKGLILDKETMRICSTLYGRTELAEQNVVHVEYIEKNDGRNHSELTVCKSAARTRTSSTVRLPGCVLSNPDMHVLRRRSAFYGQLGRMWCC